nr:MAG TPA: hypothetical protein [Caudoviricetes sp.]
MQCFPRRVASSMPRPASVSLRWRFFMGAGGLRKPRI